MNCGRLLGLTLLVVLGCGCTAAVDKAGTQAKEGPTESTTVELVRIPYDVSLPKFVVTVEPPTISTDTRGASPVPGAPQRARLPFVPGNPAPQAYNPIPPGMSDRVSTGIAAQLVSALGNAGNVVVIDHDHYKGQKSPAKLVRKGEVGPFVIRGSVTEFTEVAEADVQNKGASLGWTGAVLGVAGALTHSQAAGLTGAGVAAANPEFQKTKARRTGSVGLDLQLVDPQSGRIVGTVVAAGHFTAESATSGLSVFGIGGGEAAFAQSALGQATRAAMNDAVKQIASRLATVAQ